MQFVRRSSARSEGPRRAPEHPGLLVHVHRATRGPTTAPDSTSLSTIDHTFHFRTDAEASADGVPTIDAACASPSLGLDFTRNFPTRPERNRVSVMLHDSVHVNVPDSGTPDGHISEWYVTPALATFPRHIFFGHDSRENV